MIAVYDDKGKFLKTLGGTGQGPGEYDFIVDAKLKSDSLVILDQGTQRVTVLTPEHAVARTVRLQGTFTGLELLADGSLLAVGTKGNPATSTTPLFRFSNSGELLGAFGGEGRGVQRDRVQASDRRFRAIRDGTQVLVSRLDRYQLELWRADGTLLKTYIRSAEWYEPWTDYTIRPFDMVKPKPMTRALWQDSTGLIWTMNQVPVPNWKGARTYVPGREEPFIPFDVTDSYVETVFEVIDPASGRLVASQRFPQYMQGYLGDGRVYTLRVVDDDLRIDVWRVGLSGYK